MQPIGQHISIIIPAEDQQLLIVEKEPTFKVVVKDISPDITVPFKKGDTVYALLGKHIFVNGQFFISAEHILLYY